MPLSISFSHDLYVNKEEDWLALDLIMNGFWLIAFFINMNRVNFVMKIVTLKDTTKAYLKSPWLIPDFICIVGSITMTLLNEPVNAKYFELLRILHFKETLYPVNLCIQTFTNSGQKRVVQI